MRELECREELTYVLDPPRVTLRGSLSVRVMHDSLRRAPIDVTLLLDQERYKHHDQLCWDQGALTPIKPEHGFPTQESKEVLRWLAPAFTGDVPLRVDRTAAQLLLTPRCIMHQLRISAPYGLVLHEQARLGPGVTHTVSLTPLCDDDFPLRCEMLCGEQDPLGVQAVCTESALRIVIIVS